MKRVERAGWQRLLLGGLLVLGACGGAPTGGGGDNSAGAPASALPVTASNSTPMIRPQGPKTLPKGHESNDSTKKDEYCHRRLEDVALEGEKAPGTHGETFNPIEYIGLNSGFADPMVNDEGNVAFLGSYGGFIESTAPVKPVIPNGPGAGVFYWEHDDDELEAVAVSGQVTKVGVMPFLLNDYNGPAINRRNQVAFDANEIIGSVNSALFQWTDKSDHLKVVAKQGDEVPDAGTLIRFEELGQNNDGDIAFRAYFSPTPDDLRPLAQPIPLAEGVFFKEDESEHVELVARYGDVLPGTNGGTACGFGSGGPWVNDHDDVFFQADCIIGGTPGLQGSIFLKRRGHPVEPFWIVGDSAPTGGFITRITAGRPAANNNDFVAEIGVTGGSVYDEIATKEIEEGEYGVETCAADGATLDDGSRLWCKSRSHDADGGVVTVGPLPTIASDGTVAFQGVIGPSADTIWVPTDDTYRDAVFTCHDGKVKLIAVEGEKAPHDVGGYFGFFDDVSNADGHVVFDHDGLPLAPPVVADPRILPVDGGVGPRVISPTGVFIDDTCD